MPDIYYRLKDPVLDYLTGDLSKQELKREIQNVQRRVDGANWWTISTGLTSNIQGEKNIVELTAVLLELYEEDNLTRATSCEIVNKAKRLSTE